MRPIKTALAAAAVMVGAALALTGPPAATADPAVLDAPDVDVSAIQSHLQEFQNIATANGGNRAANTGGYAASADYVANALQAAGFDVTRQNCSTCGGDDNIIADWPGGDEANTLMLGAHLDGVTSGPGINDNGSGSTALLEVALTFAETDPTVDRHVRFAWWAAEERGLVGSRYYVSTAGVSDLDAYLNLDMVGSPNAGYFVDKITTAFSQPFVEYFDQVGKAPDEMGECCSDDGPFSNAGVPTSFISTGASATKTSTQAAKWGGTAGRSFDYCYHSSCDSYPSNIHVEALNHMADATMYALWEHSGAQDEPPIETCGATHDAPTTLPDLSTTEVPATIETCGRDAGADSTVEVDVTHSYAGDLSIVLVTPSGAEHLLKEASLADSGSDVEAVYEVDLSGEPGEGVWTLRIRDHYWGGSGVLNSWTLTV